MTDDGPVLDQINLVVRDMQAMTEFYERLGMKIAPTTSPWDRHHRTVEMPEGLHFDFDSTAFAKEWNRGWPSEQGWVVLGFRLASRQAVDQTYADLTDAGYRGQQSPYDAFWGARYAVVTDPDGNAVGLMSPVDSERTAAPPTLPT